MSPVTTNAVAELVKHAKHRAAVHLPPQLGSHARNRAWRHRKHDIGGSAHSKVGEKTNVRKARPKSPP